MDYELASQSEWNSFKQGDWDAYAKMYNRYYPLLNNYGYKFSRDVNLIQDAIHDLFVKLWNNKANLGQPASVKNYLYKSMRSILFPRLKSQSKFTLMPEDDYSFSFEISADSKLILEEEEQQLQRNIKEILAKLPGRQQEIVYLRFYEGLSYEEAAEVMEITVASAYKVWYKAMENLKGELQNLIHSVLISFFWFFPDLKINDEFNVVN